MNFSEADYQKMLGVAPRGTEFVVHLKAQLSPINQPENWDSPRLKCLAGWKIPGNRDLKELVLLGSAPSGGEFAVYETEEGGKVVIIGQGGPVFIGYAVSYAQRDGHTAVTLKALM